LPSKEEKVGNLPGNESPSSKKTWKEGGGGTEIDFKYVKNEEGRLGKKRGVDMAKGWKKKVGRTDVGRKVRKSKKEVAILDFVNNSVAVCTGLPS